MQFRLHQSTRTEFMQVIMEHIVANVVVWIEYQWHSAAFLQIALAHVAANLCA